MFAGPAESVCAAVMSDAGRRRAAGRRHRRARAATAGRRPTDPLDLQLPAVPASLQAHPHRDAPLARACPRDRDETADLLAAVGEACANAVEHAYGPAGGDRLGPPDEPTTRRRRRDRRHRSVASHRADSFRGRGITLMQALTDEVQDRAHRRRYPRRHPPDHRRRRSPGDPGHACRRAVARRRAAHRRLRRDRHVQRADVERQILDAISQPAHRGHHRPQRARPTSTAPASGCCSPSAPGSTRSRSRSASSSRRTRRSAE